MAAGCWARVLGLLLRLTLGRSATREALNAAWYPHGTVPPAPLLHLSGKLFAVKRSHARVRDPGGIVRPPSTMIH